MTVDRPVLGVFLMLGFCVMAPLGDALAKVLGQQIGVGQLVAIRMGLQVSDTLLEPGNIVAGPFHPAFGHLVQSAFFLDLATLQLAEQEVLSKRMELRVFPNDVPKLIGQNRSNLVRLVQRFNLKTIRVSGDPDVPRNTVRAKRLAYVPTGH